MLVFTILFLCIYYVDNKEISRTGFDNKAVLDKFPNDFMFGASTSAYQIEGGWNEGGKGVHMWDYLVRTKPENILDGANGDVAVNSFHLYKRDVEILKELGVQSYRFSISWTRILPYGHSDWINAEGVEYYNNLINELLANGITPFITMYHWDLPQNLSERDFAIPSDDTHDTSEAVLDYYAMNFGQYMDPIFTDRGNYPQRLIDKIAKKSFEQGFTESRLRSFSDDQVNYIRHTADFLALNSYTSDIVYRNDSLIGSFEVPSYKDDLYIGVYKDPSWVKGSSWLYSYPPGLYKLLLYIKDTYNPTIFITENGFPTLPGLKDDARVDYLRGYLQSVLSAISDGVDVRGYSFWSLMDTFEWDSGFTLRLGLYEVDLEDPERKRTPRKSALVYKQIIRSKVIDLSYDPDPCDKI
ncbi:unnamed protein product [Leptosia nina]|uniref:Beta-glucosidase n=1 Tax=Leptosia nina TaxID=320188 RepID=A0AAV1IV89_9NEOP